MNVSHVFNRIFRGSEPQGLDDITLLAVHHQVGTIINLQTAHTHREAMTAIIDLDLREYCIPSSPIFPPLKKCVEQVFDAIDRAHARGDGSVYVHCRAGVDRTGFIIAKYRIARQAWTVDAATQEWVKKGRHWWFFWWGWFL